MAGPHNVTLTQSRTRRRLPIALHPDIAHVVGRAADCNTRIDEEGVLDRHALLYWNDAALWVEPLDDAPVLVNGREATDAVRLADGDWLAFGPAVHQVELGRPRRRRPRVEETVMLAMPIAGSGSKR